MSPIPPEWRPDETDAEIFAEHTWLQGAFLGAVAYGIQAILYFMLMHKLITARKGANTRRNTGLIIYITAIFILGTLYVAGLFEFTQQSFIDGRNIPGGPNVYEEIMFSIPIDMLANVGMVLLSWMCDVINVWRCYVVYLGGHVPALAVIAVPVMIYLASVVLGILFLKQVGHTSQSPWESSGVNYTIPYYSTSLALNILVTLLIALRLAYYRNRISRIMGGVQGRQYTSLAAIVIESAAIYSTFSLLFLIPFAFGHPLAQLFLQALSPIQIVSTLLILFRVAQGRVWTKETFTQETLTTVTFGGSNKSRPKRTPGAIHIQTNTSLFTEGDTRDRSDDDSGSISLQRIDKVGTERVVEFDESALKAKNEETT